MTTQTELGAGRIWLVVAAGGWWKPAEIAEAVGAEGNGLHNQLNYMAGRKYIVTREIPPEKREPKAGRGRTGARTRMECAVTPECVVPRGLTAGDVSKALVGAVE